MSSNTRKSISLSLSLSIRAAAPAPDLPLASDETLIADDLLELNHAAKEAILNDSDTEIEGDSDPPTGVACETADTHRSSIDLSEPPTSIIKECSVVLFGILIVVLPW